MRQHFRWLAVGVATLLVTLAACTSTTPNTPPQLTPEPGNPPAPPAASSPASPPAAGSAPSSVTPKRLWIPSIGVDSTDFITVGLDSNKELQTPTLRQPKAIAWYKGSPTPGDEAACSFDEGCTQPSVMDAHINANGVEGVFAKLAKLKAGSKIAVTRSDGKTAHFTVFRVLIIKKKDFPTGTIYGAHGPSLVLITCGPGDLIRTPAGGDYLQQTVVMAKLTSMTKAQS